ncbi:hypothetical protein K2173_023837 [Erythroxylum novogranatense]|uniref:Uncharacterized protein n=1 Tax=Erythroxylum novogranatense TaxID=1862640 RepID=A0AAV8TKL9_9ROSI|nr:hypothetical protein K2173_023837 [Erythroxylum novogranatense]
MPCFNPENKPSITKKVWNSFITSVQKKLTRFRRSKLLNRASEHLLELHRRASSVAILRLLTHHYHFHHDCFSYNHSHLSHQSQPEQDDLHRVDTRTSQTQINHIVEKPVLSPGDYCKPHEDHSEEVKDVTVEVEVTDSNYSDEDAVEDYDNNCDDGDKMKGTFNEKNESVAMQLYGVDARAQEFIEKMKRRWRLEIQAAKENHESDSDSCI